ncbi:MAG: hypothetical protein FWC68_02175 [Oscillospiraceae bacterium]|nr:hypothetical protein [Oscillospiraceae bacterium]
MIEQSKPSLIEKYNGFYVSQMTSLYKGLLRNYSIQLCDKANVKIEGPDNIYDKIFNALENYISEVLPVKIRQVMKETDLVKKEEYKNVILEHDRYESAIIGKLDKKDEIRRKIILLGISRILFTHSLPLVAAEECYMQLIKDARELLLITSNLTKRNKAFELVIDIMEEYHQKLVSTKVYWDKPEERENHKKFWNEYKALEEINDEKAYKKTKQAIFLKYDLHNLYKEEVRREHIIEAYKTKLVELGSMREIPNNYKTRGRQTRKNNHNKLQNKKENLIWK